MTSDPTLPPDRLQKAQELLRTTKHATMATVNADGSPHNTPFYLIIAPDLRRVYFSSHPESLHSQNVSRTGQLFVVIFDRVQTGQGGVYLRAEHGQELHGQALAEGLRVHNATRARDGKTPLVGTQYEGDSPQRMYGADITGYWVNAAERGTDGYVVRDRRFEVTAQDLLRG